MNNNVLMVSWVLLWLGLLIFALIDYRNSRRFAREADQQLQQADQQLQQLESQLSDVWIVLESIELEISRKKYQ